MTITLADEGQQWLMVEKAVRWLLMFDGNKVLFMATPAVVYYLDLTSRCLSIAGIG